MPSQSQRMAPTRSPDAATHVFPSNSPPRKRIGLAAGLGESPLQRQIHAAEQLLPRGARVNRRRPAVVDFLGKGLEGRPPGNRLPARCPRPGGQDHCLCSFDVPHAPSQAPAASVEVPAIDVVPGDASLTRQDQTRRRRPSDRRAARRTAPRIADPIALYPPERSAARPAG